MPARIPITGFCVGSHPAFATHPLRIAHARKAEKLIMLIAIPAYDPTINVNIILIISYTMDV